MRFFKGVVVGAITSSLVLIAASALAGTGIGSVFNLGRTNTVNAQSTLKGATSGGNLQITNTGTGRALGLTVSAGKAPLVVNASAGKATNLNADELDGLDSSVFTRRSCSGLTGQIKGFAWVLANPMFSSTYTTQGIEIPYNCADPDNSIVQAKRISAGEYAVRFPNSHVAFAVATAAPSFGNVPPNLDLVSLSLVGNGAFRVAVFNAQGSGQLVDDPFIIMTM